MIKRTITRYRINVHNKRTSSIKYVLEILMVSRFSYGTSRFKPNNYSYSLISDTNKNRTITPTNNLPSTTHHKEETIREFRIDQFIWFQIITLWKQVYIFSFFINLRLWLVFIESEILLHGVTLFRYLQRTG